jgi:DGQHR domain-containing protein
MPKTKRKSDSVVVRALRTQQAKGIDVFSFFMPGGKITHVADISRLERDEEDDQLKGFQRREIRNHVKGIVEYLNQGGVLFPNAIILALSSEVKFVGSRGPRRKELEGIDAGTLALPIGPEGNRAAWIVDGQQRSIALSESNNPDLPVPVVGFVSNDIGKQREQFILVNKARPLPNRLINELLPETGGVVLPKDLAGRRIPSELCGLLNRDQTSPFYRLIKRLSDPDIETAVITDTAVVKMIRASINNPLGALAPFKAVGDEGADIAGMYRALCAFWSAVRDVFKDAWGLPPTESRLMHSAGIEAMGVLMDRVFARHSGKSNEYAAIKHDLAKMAPYCHWTEGEWDGLGLEWNQIQNTPKHIRSLADALIRIHTTRTAR